MPDRHPKLRPDLIVSRQETSAGVVYVFKDPRTGRFFRLQDAEYAVARRLDGATPLDAVARAVSTELGVEADAESLRSFVEQLQRRSLLEDPTGAPPAAAGGPFRGNILWFRLKAFDPDPLFDWLIGKIRFLFTPQFVALSVGLLLWAIGTAVVSHAEIASDLTRLWRVESLLFAWITVIVVSTLHEFAHGLTCKHFGGRVHEIGFLLIYLQPAFYCNISDAWLFPERRKRLWVTFAGGYFELFLWALATVAWRIAERGTWVNDAALVVMATSGIKQLFNFNPLIKLDGYYLLSDLLDIPNLRQRAFAYVFAWLRRLAWGRATVPELPAATPRERRVYFAYGALAVTFSYWLLGTVLLGLGRFFTAQYQAWGFAVSTGFTLAVVGSVTGKPLLPRPSAIWRPGRRAQVAILAVAMIVLLVALRLPLRVSGEFEVLPAGNADVRAEVEGIVEEVYVREGDRVTARQPIVRLSDRQAQARLRMVEAEIGEKRTRLRFGRAELERARALARAEAASRTELEQAEERVAALEQEIERSEAERRRLEGDLARVAVVAPHAGIVVTPKLHEKIGAYLRPGDLVAEVHALEIVRAEIAVPERDIGDVQVGQRGDLRLRAYPGRTFTGRVTAIAPAADTAAFLGGRTVRVTIEIPNEAGLLKPHLTGYARIDCGTRRGLDLLTRRFRRFVRVEFWSWW